MEVGRATFGAYRLLEEIGRGGVGNVYLAEHTLLGRRAAIKVLQSSVSANEEIVARFFNEARAVTRIADPGIVQIFDFGHSPDGRAFIVMELLEGEAMEKRLRRLGRLPLADCLRFARLLCASMAVAHASGIVHRDLKPENIFIVGDSAVAGGERVKILDFGVAKLSGDDADLHKTRTGALLGSPVYMSPEQCRGAGEVDHRTDIYSLGCVLFAMLTGRPPFEGVGVGELIAAHLLQSPPLLSSRVSGIPDAVEKLVQRCLDKSPDARFSSMTELSRALEAAEQRAEAYGPTFPGLHPTPQAYAALRMPPRFGPPAQDPGTLVGASGQATSQLTRARNRRGWFVRITAAMLAIGAFALVTARHGGDASPFRGSSAAPRGAGDVPAAAPGAAPTVNAGVTATVPPTPAPPAAPEAMPDAGVADALLADDIPPTEPPPSPPGTR